MTPQLAIARLVERRGFSEDETAALFGAMLAGAATPAQIGAILATLRAKGETAAELTGIVRTLRARATPVPDVPTQAVDTCGTGGDGRGTFNISTAVALVTAACGVPVAKHGNRAISSRSGSTDVLEELGVVVDLAPEALGRCVRTLGIVFLHAPALHPALGQLAGPRRELGVRTALNVAAPLANPAGVRRQIVGVASSGLVPVLAEVLSRVGCDRAWVVHGAGGLDELGLSGPSIVAEVIGRQIRTTTVRPADAGLPERPHDESLDAATPAASAACIRAVLDGAPGAPRDIVCLNVAAALVVAGAVTDLRSGAKRAAAALDHGTARTLLDRLVAFTRAEAAEASGRGTG